MTFQLVYHERFDSDVDAIRDWYEEKLPGLDDRFESELQSTITSIRERPESFSSIRGKRRRALVGGFPYLVLFDISGDIVLVVGVFHAARNPSIWGSRA